MLDPRRSHFDKLKSELRKVAEQRLSIRKDFGEWSLNDMSDFRADLEAVCKSSVSEKWFYTHLKNESETLPRVDVLHLLSQYCGYANWDAFCYEAQPSEKHLGKLSKWHILWLLVPVFGYMLWPRSRQVKVYFEDAYTKESISDTSLSFFAGNGEGISMKRGMEKLRQGDSVWVDGPYYKKKGFINSGQDTVRVVLFPDDYVMMLNFFSRSTTEDWETRRLQLEDAIHPAAKIFQSHPQFNGIEMLNREDFIDRLTLPINALKNLEIQDVVYKNDKIYRLRFLQKSMENE